MLFKVICLSIQCPSATAAVEERCRAWIYPIPSFILPDVQCDPTYTILRKGTQFEAMTGRTAPSSDGLLAEVYWNFPQL